MASNGRPRRTNRQQDRGLPGWVILLIGVALGLLIASLLYFTYGGDAEEMSAPEPPAETDDIEKSETGISLPRFEFYSILPELEVVIPEQFTDSLRKVLQPTEEADQTAEPDTNVKQPQTEKNSGTYFIQAGSFKNAEDAERMKIKLLLLGLDVKLKSVNIEDVKYHRVRIGPLTDYESFEMARKRLKDNDVQFLVLKSREQ
jgi:cell division protein FtsN